MFIPLASALSDLFTGSLLNLVYAAALLVGVVYAFFLLFFQGIGDALGDFDLNLDGDLDVDADADGTGEAVGISMLAVASFVSAFGASGLISVTLLDAGRATSLILALAGGLIIGLLAQLLFMYVLSPTISSEIRQAKLVGLTGEITTPIPANGVGQIALIAEGSRITFSARSTKHGEVVPRGMPVRVERISGNIAYVSPLD